MPSLSQTAVRWRSGDKRGAGIRVKHLAVGRRGARTKKGGGGRGGGVVERLLSTNLVTLLPLPFFVAGLRRDQRPGSPGAGVQGYGQTRNLASRTARRARKLRPTDLAGGDVSVRYRAVQHSWLEEQAGEQDQ